MNKIEDMKILRSLKEEFGVEEVRYDVLSKTFRYKFTDQKERNITLDALIKLLAENKNDIYHNLMILKRGYFPRRLKEVIVSFYEDNGLSLPRELFITEAGFELIIDDQIHYVKYSDDFELFLIEFAKIMQVKNHYVRVIPQIKDYKGHYHD